MNLVQKQYTKLEGLLQNGQYEKALAVCEKVLKLEPDCKYLFLSPKQSTHAVSFR